jgi:quinohemoprotein ethanol dehydrogenase
MFGKSTEMGAPTKGTPHTPHVLTLRGRSICWIAQLAALILCASALGAPARAVTAVDGQTTVDGKQGANWLSNGRTYSEQHFSPLAKINDSNVSRLGVAWFLDLPGQRTLQATPLAVDGVLYFSGTYGRTYAVDARSGKELWEFDPELTRYAPDKLRMLWGSHRGVAWWRGKVYVGVIDGRLIALDSKTGNVVWSVQTFDSPLASKAITGAPRVFNGKVIIGHGDGEAGTRGYVTAYDAETGKQVWRFYTVPGDPKKGFEDEAQAMAAKTWDGEWWHWGGGAPVWDTIVYDLDFNRVYLATGNGVPINAAIRSPGHGDNLFVSSIVAVDADTGKYVWHYQVNPRDSWDYDATEGIVLTELEIGGKSRKVLMQAPKNGFFYVLDRATGKLLSAEKYAKATWADRIDLKTGRPVEMPNLHYENGPVQFWPSSAGAHSWQAMSFDPRTVLAYIPTMHLGMQIAPARSDEGLKNFGNPHRRYALLGGITGGTPPSDPQNGTGGLLAWDPVAQKKRWEVHYEDSFWNGGTLATAGNLVFQGTGRGHFFAYDARTGKRLWAFYAGLGINAAPIAYELDGVQYISILVGYGGQAGIGGEYFDYGWRFGEQPRRLLTFALDKHVHLPPSKPPRFEAGAIDDPKLVIDTEAAGEGLKLYHSTCVLCHGTNAESTGSIAPDLRESTLALSWDAFRSVLRDGTLAAGGMPKYDDLTDQDLRALFFYVRQRARETKDSASQKQSKAPVRH